MYTPAICVENEVIYQTGKYVLCAEDLPRANKLLIKHGKFEKCTDQARRFLQSENPTMEGSVVDSGYERVSDTLSVNSAQRISKMALL